jgi:putative redox protein
MTADDPTGTHVQAQSIIENAEAIRDIMAGAIAEASAGRGRRSVYRAQASLTKNLTVEVNARQFTFLVDEPPSFGGADAGPNPEEVVLAGVGACQAITAALYAGYLGIPLRRYDVRVRGYADLGGFYGVGEPGASTGFDRVVCDVTIESDATEEQLAAFEQLVEERCVGHGTLRAPVAVESHWTINGRRRPPS